MASVLTPIRFARGDATDPEGHGPRIVAHVCNDIGAWGRGFVLALSRRWGEPEAAYREWHAAGAEAGFALGGVQFVQVEPSIWVANMIGQHGVRRSTAGPPIRYEALTDCLARVADKARDLGASVHMPRIGCGLAGGDWSRVEQIVQGTLSERGVPVTVYDFT
jgi:O-acetyl-ADP-ribose deacetylase (regulator of RNase III)